MLYHSHKSRPFNSKPHRQSPGSSSSECRQNQLIGSYMANWANKLTAAKGSSGWQLLWWYAAPLFVGVWMRHMAPLSMWMVQQANNSKVAAWLTERTSWWQQQIAAVSGCSGDMLPPFCCFMNKTHGQFLHIAPLSMWKAQNSNSKNQNEVPAGSEPFDTRLEAGSKTFDTEVTYVAWLIDQPPEST